MKKLIALFTLVLLLLALPFAASAAEETLTVTPPDKIVYTVGETPDYTGGQAVYVGNTEYIFPLSDTICAGFDTATPGNKLVSVTIRDTTAYFTVVVLSEEEPVYEMKDITHDHWSFTYFAAVMKAGYFTGDETGRIHPDVSITRAEMATIIYRAWQHDPRVMMEKEDAVAPFPDVPADAWYFEAVDACRKAGILRGMETGNCEPETPISRQDAILMLMRIRYTDDELNAVNIQETVAASGVNPTDFHKVAGYAAPAVALALGNTVKGDQNGAINPQSSITRGESAAILYRTFFANYTWQPPVQPVLIYLSPSNQFTNPYAAGNTNEGDEMNKVAAALKIKLEALGYQVYIPNGTTSIYDRPAEAAELGADLYIPIHSNAGGNRGTYVFYNSAVEGGTEFSRCIFDRLAALTGTAYSTNRHKEDVVSLGPNGRPFHELSTPTVPAAYIEVEFHDKADLALWIINNTDAIAQAICNGITDYLRS